MHTLTRAARGACSVCLKEAQAVRQSHGPQGVSIEETGGYDDDVWTPSPAALIRHLQSGGWGMKGPFLPK